MGSAYTGKLGCDCRRRDQQVDRSATSCLVACADDRGIDATVGARCRDIERDRLERCLGPLKAVLSACAFLWVDSGMRPRREFRECDRSHCYFDRQHVLDNLLDFDDDRRIYETARIAWRLS